MLKLSWIRLQRPAFFNNINLGEESAVFQWLKPFTLLCPSFVRTLVMYYIVKKYQNKVNFIYSEKATKI